MARPFLKAWNDGGMAGALAAGREIIDEIRLACLLTGSKNVAALHGQPLVIGPDLDRWVPGQCELRRRYLSA
jgi:isopentenyl diphosphate isomerase/L-lactate dehydrogenase-like FMN-dependent dehydrogenase